MSTRLPYQPGPISRLFAWLDASDLRLWTLTAVVTVVLLAWTHAVLWSTGRLAVGVPDIHAFIIVVYTSWLFPAWIIYRRLARGAVVAFWPATGWPEADQASWIYRFEYVSVRTEAVALLVGILAGIGSTLAAPAEIVGAETGRLGSWVAFMPMFVSGYALTAVGIVVVWRCLRFVSQIHREARLVNPFERVPLYAFSRLTVYVGLFIALGLYYTVTINSAFLSGNLPAFVFVPVTTVLAVVAFILPLWGIHGRLVQEKEDLLADVERRMTVAATELYQRVDSGAFDGAKAVSDSVAGLTALRERVARLPTWPWRPELFRGFITALLLPIVIYLITRVISTVFTP